MKNLTMLATPLFRMDNIELMASADTTTPPSNGQFVKIAPITIQLAEDTVIKAYRLLRPEPPNDNAIWTDDEFEQFPIFTIRWREFRDIEIRPRECRGYGNKARQKLDWEKPIVLTPGLYACFSCILYPVTPQPH
ncbi:MAG TPA: hypothetical protein VGF56_13870 [Rhizomicrobium sp.]|jgi:hypothetical protein